MILGKLNLNESQTMNFGISVFGTAEQPSIIRFVIENDDFDIVCKCKQLGEELEVDIPPLKGILGAKEYNTRLEVIIGDKIFTPLRESIEFNPLVEFGVQKKDIKVKSEGVEIKVNATSTETKKSKLQENIDKAIESGYSIKKVNEFTVLVKNDLFYGFVNESSLIESQNGFKTLTDLVNNLSE